MIVQFLGRHGEVLKSVTPPPLCISISIREAAADCRKEHFQGTSPFPEWNPKRKITDLPDPPPEVR